MFIDKTGREKVSIAVNKANILMLNNKFYNEVEKSDFTHTTDTSKVIAHYLKLTFKTYEINVVTYKPWWRWSKAIAYVNKKNPFEIHLNAYRLPKRSIDDIVATLCHEISHSAGYGHGSNKKSKSKMNSVPYKVATIAKKIMSKEC